jgi:methylated-DNA-[protein]-cysteine S-methyltransferase
MKSKYEFARRVQAVVRTIKRGKTMTYGQVAAAAGRPGAARAVGNVMAHNDDKTVPCHRVIRADGTLGGYNNINGPSKEALLKKEGAVWKSR